jgi:hypothetical protein
MYSASLYVHNKDPGLDEIRGRRLINIASSRLVGSTKLSVVGNVEIEALRHLPLAQSLNPRHSAQL